MNIEEFVNDYLQEHRHEVLLNPYNGLIDFANAFKDQMMKEAVEGEVMTNGFYPYEPRIVAPYPNCPYDFGDKVRIIIVKED